MEPLALPTGEVLTAADGAALVVVPGFQLQAWDYVIPENTLPASLPVAL